MALGRGLSVLINPGDVAAVADGVFVNAVSAVGQMVARPRASRRTSAGMDLAGWMDTDRLTREGLPGARLELPELTDAEAAELEAALKRDEVQGALQALLAVRLTDAPETDAARAREVVAARLAACDAVWLAIGGPAAVTDGDGASVARDGVKPPQPATKGGQPPATGAGPTGRPDQRGSGPTPASEPAVTGAAARYAEQLSEYFDDKISALVATLEGRVGIEGLAQVRAEAYNSRIVALLGAIERQVAALGDPRRGGQAESEFLERYRRQAHARHGYLYPPDFDRRRKVPVAQIYVNTPIIEHIEHIEAETGDDYDVTNVVRNIDLAAVNSHSKRDRQGLTTMDLPGRLGRTVLLGNPGSGKTTASNVLADYFAGGGSRRVPFLVTLREYAAKTPLEWSVLEHIEQNLNAVYQTPAPDGLVERLLLTDRAVVIFDGLDELLDTSRRRDMSERIEQFCSAYPLTPVLVTSRLVGYDQARLDEDQFICYRLDTFGDTEVAEYTGKWFTIQDGSTEAEASAKTKGFLAESANAKDLRANPLLLALMCILYRGTGSLPGDRAGIYVKCAELLLRKWDEQRDLYRKVRADHLVERTIQHLAWWLFSREDGRALATERELVAKVTEFLQARGFETEDEARVAAREFVEFCRSRMWVLSDVGVTADDERLYAFTHRTFLEYFTAVHLAATSDTPEILAQAIAAHIGVPAWNLVAEIAIQIKDRSIDRGADRVYRTLIDLEPAEPFERVRLLDLLSVSLASVRPSPATARLFASAVLDFMLDQWDMLDYIVPLRHALLSISARYQLIVSDEIGNRIAQLAAAADARTRARGLELLLEISRHSERKFFAQWANEQIEQYADQILAEAAESGELRNAALFADAISLEQALAMPGSLSHVVRFMRWRIDAWDSPRHRRPDPPAELAIIGRYLVAHPDLPWASSVGRRPRQGGLIQTDDEVVTHTVAGELSGLGLAAIFAVDEELHGRLRSRTDMSWMPMPNQFRQVFWDWARERVNFVEFLAGEPNGRLGARDRSG